MRLKLTEWGVIAVNDPPQLEPTREENELADYLMKRQHSASVRELSFEAKALQRYDQSRMAKQRQSWEQTTLIGLDE